MSDELMELPEGWELTTLGETFNVYVGATLSRKVPEYWGGSIPWVSSGEVAFCQIHTTRETITEKGLQNTSTEVHPPGTILLGMIGEGKTRGQAAILKVNAAHNQNSAAIRVSEAGLIPKYLYYFLEQEYERTRQVSSGNNQPALNKSRVQAMAFPLAPLNEQRRIVEAIESLTNRSQNARLALSAIPELCDKFRQSVLAAAFRGDLTADWREQNPDVEPASVLLERIRCDSQSRSIKQKVNLEETELSSLPEIPNIAIASLVRTGCRGGTSGWGQRPHTPSQSHCPKLCGNSYTWAWERLTNISGLLGGVTKGRKFNGQVTIQVPYLRVANVQDGFLDLEEIKEIEVLPEDINKYRLEHGDILFTEGGDRDKLGRGTVWQGEIEGCIHQNHVYRARLFNSDVLPEYISLAAKTKYAKDYFFHNASQTVNLASINISTLGKRPLPIPPTDEKEICSRVYKLFEISEVVKSSHYNLLHQFNQIDRSILAKAFRGELVEQDPNDESASVLLDHIRAEREQQTQTTSSRRKRGLAK